MDHSAYIEAAARDVDAIRAAVTAGPVAAAVPTCEGWTVADLAAHVGQFCGFWCHVLCEGTGRSKPDVPDPPGGEASGPWFAAVGDALLVELKATPPETPVWTWYEPDQTAGFVARRVANELAVHRYDAESARGTPNAVEAGLAVDGIDEMLDRLILMRARTGEATGQTLHLHAIDEGVDGEWLVAFHADAVEVRREHAKADLGLRGTASDLELVLYQRPPLGEVQRFGDPSVLDLWYREFTF